jgi:murein DD-endopeptidase MepM/ murein hydrolase activator NlpD
MQQEDGILAQKLPRLIAGTRLWRIALGVTLPLIGMVAAFGIAPGTDAEVVIRTHVVQDLKLPLTLSEGRADEEGYWREERIQRGDSLAELLARLGAEDTQAVEFLRSARSAKTLYQLVPGRTVRALATPEGRLLALRYQGGDKVLNVRRQADGFEVTESPVVLERRVMMKSGEIVSSLFAATDAAGLSDAVAMQIADIFSTDIDFHRDLRRGDHFTVVYEMYHDMGVPVRSGRLLAAEFVNQGKTYQAVYYEHPDKQWGYYTPEGRNIRKAFLRSPLEFSRISSGFTTARFHPILQRWRAHKGIDYAAPLGTRVKATGDGIVEFAGQHAGGYGNLVVLRHQSKYTTWYGHLSRIAPGIRKGARVTQGSVIGSVGATGLATGPHLHYEFRINDVHQNPLRVVLPSAPPIGPEQKAAFDAATVPLAERLLLLRGTRMARLD